MILRLHHRQVRVNLYFRSQDYFLKIETFRLYSGKPADELIWEVTTGGRTQLVIAELRAPLLMRDRCFVTTQDQYMLTNDQCQYKLVRLNTFDLSKSMLVSQIIYWSSIYILTSQNACKSA